MHCSDWDRLATPTPKKSWIKGSRLAGCGQAWRCGHLNGCARDGGQRKKLAWLWRRVARQTGKPARMLEGQSETETETTQPVLEAGSAVCEASIKGRQSERAKERPRKHNTEAVKQLTRRTQG